MAAHGPNVNIIASLMRNFVFSPAPCNWCESTGQTFHFCNGEKENACLSQGCEGQRLLCRTATQTAWPVDCLWHEISLCPHTLIVCYRPSGRKKQQKCSVSLSLPYAHTLASSLPLIFSLCCLFSLCKFLAHSCYLVCVLSSHAVQASKFYLAVNPVYISGAFRHLYSWCSDL